MILPTPTWRTGKTRLSWLCRICVLGCFSGLLAQTPDFKKEAEERNLKPLRELYAKGDYDTCARMSELYLTKGAVSADWWVIRLRSLASLGRSEDAIADIKKVIHKNTDSLPLLITCHEVAKSLGQKELASSILQQFNAVALKLPAGQRTPRDLVALGNAALALGADPQKVIQQFFDPSRKKDRALIDTYLATGELALVKSDAARAANEFRAGLKEQSANTDLLYGLARAQLSSDRKKSVELARQVLDINPNHAGAALLMAEHYLGAELFPEAELQLAHVLEVNPHHPEAWALRSVLALLVSNNPEEAAKARSEALHLWLENPQVDELIGECLSRAYRFREAAEHQRQALKFDPGSLSAKLQLCHDLFRLGQETEAWQLAREVREADAYNIQAYNIGLLEAEMKGFTVREEADFVLKMPTRDAVIYGDRALVILREAKQVLGTKYGMVLDHPVLVEFFPTQQDFAIRTLGNLGGQGILGACFGTVVTMNSPGSVAASRSNWESTLWHEFCHVITLSVTKNRMPRWLSEGISVYEEEQRDPACGMKMTARYREMVLDDESLTPLSKMSSAFMTPPTGEHLMFAYFESSQAVKWLLKTFGPQKLQGVLRDLADGQRINEALAKNTDSVEKLDERFQKFIREAAMALSPGADWTKLNPEDLDATDAVAVSTYLKAHPNHVGVLQLHAKHLIGAEQWVEALKVGMKLMMLLPDDVDGGSGYEIAMRACRELNRPADEAGILRDWIAHSGDAAEALNRLLELDTQSENWKSVQSLALRSLAINPFLKHPYEALALASEKLNDQSATVQALQKLHALEPDNMVEVNYKLARLLKNKDSVAAKRYLLDALAEAPRYQAAHQLLLEMQTHKP
ncbi:tetratricopeptide repeat protein [soil metagenome]